MNGGEVRGGREGGREDGQAGGPEPATGIATAGPAVPGSGPSVPAGRSRPSAASRPRRFRRHLRPAPASSTWRSWKSRWRSW
jgi:hypothetical protein